MLTVIFFVSAEIKYVDQWERCKSKQENIALSYSLYEQDRLADLHSEIEWLIVL